MRGKRSIHRKIKECLGYEPDAPDPEVRKDWRERTSRVCKPCWELKYCPYGPLVEQLPLLPLTSGAVSEHNAYLQKCLDTGLVGEIEMLTPDRREELARWLEDDQLLLMQALNHLRRERSSKVNVGPREGPLPPPHEYRVRFDWTDADPKSIADLPQELRRDVRKRITEIKRTYREGLRAGQLLSLIHI